MLKLNAGFCAVFIVLLGPPPVIVYDQLVGELDELSVTCTTFKEPEHTGLGLIVKSARGTCATASEESVILKTLMPLKINFFILIVV